MTGGQRQEDIGVLSIVGNYEDGVLTGRGKVIMTDGSVREGWFQHGYFHGPTRCILYTPVKKMLTTLDCCRGSEGVSNINFIGHYKAGLPSGTVWTKQVGG